MLEQKENMPSPDDQKFSELREKWNKVYASERKIEYNQKTIEFVEKLAGKYKDSVNNYRLFDLLLWNTKLDADYAEFDLPGEYSIENFINQCYEELFPEQKQD